VDRGYDATAGDDGLAITFRLSSRIGHGPVGRRAVRRVIGRTTHVPANLPVIGSMFEDFCDLLDSRVARQHRPYRIEATDALIQPKNGSKRPTKRLTVSMAVAILDQVLHSDASADL